MNDCIFWPIEKRKPAKTKAFTQDGTVNKHANEFDHYTLDSTDDEERNIFTTIFVRFANKKKKI